MEGWISLYRKFMNWQWYKDSNVKAVFIHLLLCANHKEEMVGKRIVKRGQLIASRDSLSEATGLSPREIRTCLSKLKSTDEIEVEITNKHSVITIKKYDVYQRNFEEGATSKTTSKTTSQKETVATSKTTSKATTNNNIYNNINNNMTRLDYIFNLIINNDYENLKLEKVKFEGFKLWLKRLDLNATQDFIDFLEIEKQLEYKVIITTLLKVYTNSYKVYGDKITRNDIFHKILKSKEYKGNLETMNDEEIKKFANYYLKCLENFVDGSDTNAKI